VADKKANDATTRAILEFNRKLYDAKEYYTTILPIRDGLAVAVKK
jgi:predicted O-methyltransferase YrrM